MRIRGSRPACPFLIYFVTEFGVFATRFEMVVQNSALRTKCACGNFGSGRLEFAG